MIFAFVVAAFAATLFADSEKSANAIIRLLNSRAAGSQRAYEEAARVVREDAEKGRALQRFLLAILSRDVNAPDAARLSERQREEYLASREKIRKLAETNGNPLALYLLSMESGDIGQLERAASGGNVQALNALGTLRLTEVESDAAISPAVAEEARSKAYGCFKRASDQGDVNGLYNLGVCLMNGYGCTRDGKKAFDCFRVAAEAGHAEAINNLGGFFRDGVLVRKDLRLSVAWFHKSAEMRNEYGILNYAQALLSGEGVKPDHVSAAKLLRYLSEDRKHPEGMCMYGMCLLRGVGVGKDEVAAFEWFRKSAEAGLPMAMNNLSDCYESGSGVGVDHVKALEWKMRARAASGDRAAAEWVRNSLKTEAK